MNGQTSQLRTEISAFVSAAQDLSEKQVRAELQQSMVAAFLNSFHVGHALQDVITTTISKMKSESLGEWISTEFFDSLELLNKKWNAIDRAAVSMTPFGKDALQKLGETRDLACDALFTWAKAMLDQNLDDDQELSPQVFRAWHQLYSRPILFRLV